MKYKKKIYKTDLIEKSIKFYMLTEEQFCKTRDIPLKDFKKVLNQDTNINFSSIQKISKAVGVNTKDFLYEDTFENIIRFCF